MQAIKADDYIGQRLRLSIRLKSERALAVRMFFRVGGADGKPLQFANNEKNLLTGTAGWKQYELVLDVPPGSTTINYGFSLAGNAGKGWADAISLTAVDKSVPSSDMLSGQGLSARPVNMNFDQ